MFQKLKYMVKMRNVVLLIKYFSSGGYPLQWQTENNFCNIHPTDINMLYNFNYGVRK